MGLILLRETGYMVKENMYQQCIKSVCSLNFKILISLIKFTILILKDKT